MKNLGRINKESRVINFIVLFEIKQNINDEFSWLEPSIILQYTSSVQVSPTTQIISEIKHNIVFIFSTSSSEKGSPYFSYLSLLLRDILSPSRLKHCDFWGTYSSKHSSLLCHHFVRVCNHRSSIKPVL